MWEELKFITYGAYLLCRAPRSILAAQTWQILEYLIASSGQCPAATLPLHLAPIKGSSHDGCPFLLSWER